VRKSTRNYITGIIMFLLAVFEAVSGFVLWLVLPRGGEGYMGGRGGGSIAAGTFLWPRDTWLDLHNWVGVALVVVVVLHLVLHRRWIVHTTKTFFRRQELSKEE
jgi:hypothetical protein